MSRRDRRPRAPKIACPDCGALVAVVITKERRVRRAYCPMCRARIDYTPESASEATDELAALRGALALD